MIPLCIQSLDSKIKFVMLIKQEQVVDVRGVSEHPFSVQTHQLLMHLIGNICGVVIADWGFPRREHRHYNKNGFVHKFN